MKRNSIIRKGTALLLSLLICLGASGCQAKEEEAELDLSQTSFEDLVEQAKGSTVSFYGWGGDELINNWIDTVFAPQMKENMISPLTVCRWILTRFSISFPRRFRQERRMAALT